MNLFSGRSTGSASRPGTAGGRVAIPDTNAHPHVLAYRHAGAIHVLSVSPDGGHLALAGAGPVDREQRKHRVYKEHFETVVESDILVADAAADLAAADAATRLRAFSGHTGPVQDIAWEAGVLWSCAADRCVRAVSRATGASLAHHQLHNDIVLGVMPDVGRALAAATASAPAAESAGSTIGPESTASQEGVDAEWHESAHPAPSAPPIPSTRPVSSTPPTPSAPASELIDGVGASISADRTLMLWERRTGRVVHKEFLSSAIVLDALMLDGAGPDDTPVFLATDQHRTILGRFGADAPRALEPLKFDEPIYRLVPSRDAGHFWAGHRLGAVLRCAVDPAGSKLVEEDRLEVFDGCRPLGLQEFEHAGRRWLAAGSLRGDVALVSLADRAIHRLPRPLASRATALASWGGHLFAADYHGWLYDLTPWLSEVAGA